MSEPLARLVHPPVEILVIYRPTSGVVEIKSGSSEVDQVIVALARAWQAVLASTVKVGGR